MYCCSRHPWTPVWAYGPLSVLKFILTNVVCYYVHLTTTLSFTHLPKIIFYFYTNNYFNYIIHEPNYTISGIILKNDYRYRFYLYLHVKKKRNILLWLPIL